jgi:hypothetical protein
MQREDLKESQESRQFFAVEQDSPMEGRIPQSRSMTRNIGLLAPDDFVGQLLELFPGFMLYEDIP